MKTILETSFLFSTIAPIPMISELTTGLDGINWNTVFVAFFGLASMIATGLMAIYMAKVKAGVDAVHTAVNSERTATLAEMNKLREVILEMTKAKSASDENARALASESKSNH